MKRFLSAQIPVFLLGASIAPWSTSGVSIASSSVKQAGASTRPNLGWMTVRPKRAHIGQTVTISGKTNGFVQFLPPYVFLQHTLTTVINNGPGMCGGREVVSIVTKTVKIGGGAGGPGARTNPPAGTVWKVRFRVPATMDAPRGNNQLHPVPTPSGSYRIVAIAAGMDGPCGPVSGSSTFVSVNYFTVG